MQLLMKLPHGPCNRRFMLLWFSINSSVWTVICRNPAIPYDLQLELGLFINLGGDVGSNPDASALITNTLPRSGNGSINVDGIVAMGADVLLSQGGGIFLHSERSDVHVSLSPTNDPSLTLILPLEGLNLLAVKCHGSKVIIKEDFGQRSPLLGEIVEVA
ncbi:hypothetical protein BHM03_00053242 [Ensete ventricosum]|nr:hypothetical protein BHM03_00053242 [Ensete ventricosum]